MNDPTSSVFAWSVQPRRRPMHAVVLLNHSISLRGLVIRVIELALLLAALVALHGDFIDGDRWRLASVLIYLVIAMSMMQTFALYQRHRTAMESTVGRLVLAYAVTGVVFAGLAMLLPIETPDKGPLLATLAVTFGLSLMLRLALPHLSTVLIPPIRVLVVGDGGLADEVVAVLRDSDSMEGLQFCGRFDPRQGVFHGTEDEEPRHGSLSDVIAQESASEVVLAVSDQRGLPLAELLRLRMEGVLVTDYVSFLEREKRYLATDQMRPSWLIFSNGFHHGPGRVVGKRIFDIVVSGLLLVGLAPLLALAVLAIYLESGRPIFYRQERVGTGGKLFTVLKLRSMVVDAEQNGVPQWAQQNDPRVTRVGRILRLTRIDEIPQLWSVLKGDMSFVGPRPERQHFVEQLRASIPYYDLRHAIKPGLSGWAQVCYPYGSSVEDARAKLRYDLYYIKNHSILLDVLILLNTVHVVTFGKGAR